MIGRFLAEADRAASREEEVEVAAFDEANRSYSVVWRGCLIGPVWSANGVRHRVGAKSKALVRGGLVLALIP